MFQPWRADDFLAVVKTVSIVTCSDFWEPERATGLDVVVNETRAPSDFWEAQSPDPVAPTLGAEALVLDFWDPLPPSTVHASNDVSDWWKSAGPALFHPDDFIRESPFAFPDERPTRESIARRRARWLASLLDIPTEKSRRRFAGQFEELFDAFPHHSTFRVLSELAIDGVSADDLLTGFRLKLIWADNPILWSFRHKRNRTPLIPEDGSTRLGWTRAILLADLARGLPAESIIDPDWRNDWLKVPFGDPLYWSFLEYATARLESFSNGVLEVPDVLARLEERRSIHSESSSITIDGVRLGAAARTAHLMQSYALSPSKPIPRNETKIENG